MAELYPTLHPHIHRGGVLVLEDNQNQRRQMVSILRSLGISKIYEAANGLAGLTLIHQLYQPPALIVLDLEMPGMDGIEFIQQLATEGIRSSLLLAGAAGADILASVEFMLEMMEIPLLGVVRKPFSSGQVGNALTQYAPLNPSRNKRWQTSSQQISVAALQLALDENRIVPVYQPKVSLLNGEVTGVEALARWQEPDGRVIPPNDFIELAEQHSLIDQLTLNMLDATAHDLKAWHRQGCYPTVAINISAHSLSNPDFSSEIIQRVAQARISPSSWVLEITESALVSDVVVAMGSLGRFRLKGFSLSIDDFGTGFSSMQQLSRLPFTELKIDRSFVHRAAEKKSLRVMLESALHMSHRLGLTTVAEGIETEEELMLLKALGCNYAQGYLIAKPMSGAELAPWVCNEQSRFSILCCSH